MAFTKKQQAVAMQASANRIAAIAGGGVAVEDVVVEGAAPGPRQVLHVDMSRIRPRGVEETPVQRKKRLMAKAINFTATIFARLAIIAGLGLYIWSGYEMTGNIHRGSAVGITLIFADLGRVILKAMEPGTK